MPMNNVVVSSYGKEKKFISDFIKSIMAESAFTSQHSLVCKIGSTETESEAVTVTSAEVDTQLETAFGTATNKPTIWFVIDTNVKIKLTRNSVLSSGTTFYHAYVTVGQFAITQMSSEYFTSSLQYKSSSSSSGDDSYNNDTERCWKYQIVSNDKALYLVFGSYNENFPLAATIPDSSYERIKTYQVFSYKNGTDWIGGLHCGHRLYGADSVRTYAVNRLPYVNNANDPTAIETIQNKVIREYTGTAKVMTMTNIYDSSYNSAVMFPVNIDNNQYVYLNKYTLMPI